MTINSLVFSLAIAYSIANFALRTVAIPAFRTVAIPALRAFAVMAFVYASVQATSTAAQAEGQARAATADISRVAPQKNGAEVQLVSIRAKAELAANKNVLTSGLTWRIAARNAENDSGASLIHESHGAKLTTLLEPGDYLIMVSFGQAYRIEPVSVLTSPIDITLGLDAAVLQLLPTLGDPSQLLTQPSSVRIYRLEAVGGKMSLVVTQSISGEANFRLPPGLYRIDATIPTSNASSSSMVRLESGNIVISTLNFAAGIVEFKLVDSVGGPSYSDVDWVIQEQVTKNELSISGGSQTVVLRSGDYRVTANKNGVSESRVFQVADNQQQIVELTTTRER